MARSTLVTSATRFKVAVAIDLAHALHAGQKYGARVPYTVHLQAVASWVEYVLPDDEDAVCAAWLHDVLEDTGFSRKQLHAAMGKRVADLVEWCTDEPGTNRRERKAVTHAKLAECNDVPALVVKLADRLDNVLKAGLDKARLTRMYLDESGAFRHAVYRDDARTIPLQRMLDLVMQGLFDEEIARRRGV